MSYFTAPQRRMYCERLIDGKWTAVRDNEEIVFRDEELNSFDDSCTNELYNIGSVWADCKTDILGNELKGILSDATHVNTLRLSELDLFIDKVREEMYGAVTLEAIRSTQQSEVSREAFDMALDSFAELKSIYRDVLEILGERPKYIDYADIRIVWAGQA